MCNRFAKATLISILWELIRIRGVCNISTHFEENDMKPTMTFESISFSERLVAAEQAGQHTEWEGDAVNQLSVLTPRQHQIMDLVLAGKPSKNIATDLGISRRTVENHRAAIMLKTGSKSIPALARLAFMPKVIVPNPVSFLPKLSLA